MPNQVFSSLFFALACTLSIPVAALEPCPKSPCLDEWGVNPELCSEAADWVALGYITDIEHNERDLPIKRNFAKFRFRPTRWEKPKNGPKDARSEYAFQVGYCENTTEPIENPKLLVRVYGLNERSDAIVPGFRYLYLEAAE